MTKDNLWQYEGKSLSEFTKIESLCNDKEIYYQGFDGDIFCSTIDDVGDVDLWMVISDDVNNKKPFGVAINNKIMINWTL